MQLQGYDLLGSWRCGEVAHMTGVLQWMVTSSIVRIVQKGEEGVALSVRDQQQCREL